MPTIADYRRFMKAIRTGKNLSPAEMLSYHALINEQRQFFSIHTDTTNDNKKIKPGYGLGRGLFKTRYGQVFFKEGRVDAWKHYNQQARIFPKQNCTQPASNSFYLNK